jgi:type IV pilus assembly protein PilA
MREQHDSLPSGRAAHAELGARLTRRGAGFSIVEMLVVIGVVATLALMALPSYIEKSVREQVAEALPLAEVAKPPLVTAWALAQPFPADNAAAGLPIADKIVNNYVSSVAVQDGAITLTFGNQASNSIKGKLLTIRPAVVEDSPVVPVAWVCGNAAVPGKMTVKGANRTNLPPLFLPLRCRAL